MLPEGDLERLLREARAALPEPDGDATVRAWNAARAAVSSRRRRTVRVVAALAVFVLAVALGVAIGALAAPNGEAAKEPVGLGFLPAPGWQAFQTGTEASRIYQTVAVASNVPLAPEDLRAGSAEASGLPYTTLQQLPADGIVMVASFTREDGLTFPDPEKRTLPLTLADAAHYVPYGTQVRPGAPLGQWALRAAVRGRVVEVVIYFGTQSPSAELQADANRQLARLVMQPISQADGASRPTSSPSLRRASSPSVRPTAAASAASPAGALVERTLSCGTGLQGGVRLIDVMASSALRRGKSLERLAQVVVDTPGSPLPSQPNEYRPELVAMTAGHPAPPPLRSGGLGYNGKLCKPVNATVPFSTKGLAGGSATVFGDGAKCISPRTVLVRFRVDFMAPPSVKVDRKSGFRTFDGRIRAGRMAVRTPGGKLLAYADLFDSGRANVFTARSCL